MGAVAGRRSAERVTQSNGEERRVVPVGRLVPTVPLRPCLPGGQVEWHGACPVRFAPARRARGRPVAARRRRWSVPVRGRDGGAAASPSEPRLTRDRVTVRGRRGRGETLEQPAGSGTRCRSATRLGTLYGFGAYRLRGGPRTRLARRPPGAAMGAAPRACSAQRCRARVRVPPVPCWRRRSPYSSVASAYGYRVPRYPGRAPSAEPRTARGDRRARGARF